MVRMPQAGDMDDNPVRKDTMNDQVLPIDFIECRTDENRRIVNG